MNVHGAPDRDPHALLRLCHLVSPALPVGAYAYSQGLEYAVHAGWVHDEATTLDWLQGLSPGRSARWTCRSSMRLHRAWQRADLAAVRALECAADCRARNARAARARNCIWVVRWRGYWSNWNCARPREWHRVGGRVCDAVQPGRGALAHRCARCAERLPVGLERESGAGGGQAGAAGAIGRPATAASAHRGHAGPSLSMR